MSSLILIRTALDAILYEAGYKDGMFWQKIYKLENDIRDPREFPTLQIIMHQRQIGRSPTEIAKFLSGKDFKTRHGISWGQAHIFNIVKRLKNSESNQ